MKVKFWLAGTDRVIEAEVADAKFADLVVEIRNPDNGGAGWLEVTHAASGWPVLLNLAQVAQIERAGS